MDGLRAKADLLALLRVARRVGRVGAPRSFGLGHLLLALYYIDENARVSRERLGMQLGLGGGAVKSLISKLRESSLIRTSKGGNVLSDDGLKIVRGLRAVVPTISVISVRSLSTGKESVAAIIRGVDVKGLDPISMRDEVIRAGGTGATTLLFDGNSIRVPGVYDDLAAISGSDVEALTRLNLRRGDIVLIAGGNDRRAAGIACAAAIAGFLSGCLRQKVVPRS